jgi:hypothetical protein
VGSSERGGIQQPVTDGPSADRSITPRSNNNNNNSNSNVTVMSLLKQPAGRAIDSGLMETEAGLSHHSLFGAAFIVSKRNDLSNIARRVYVKCVN